MCESRTAQIISQVRISWTNSSAMPPLPTMAIRRAPLRRSLSSRALCVSLSVNTRGFGLQFTYVEERERGARGERRERRKRRERRESQNCDYAHCMAFYTRSIKHILLQGVTRRKPCLLLLGDAPMQRQILS